MNPLLKWGVIIGSFLIWRIISPFLYAVLLSLGVSQFAIGLILGIAHLVFIMEIVFRILFRQVLHPLKYVPTNLETWPQQHKDDLARYTAKLEKLGFIKLMDYTAPSINGGARLLGHPEHCCFAEVGQVNSTPVFCNFSTLLEDRWALRMTNMPSQRLASAVGYAFLRLPQVLGKRREQATTVEVLFQSLLEWQQQASKDLGIKVIQEITAEIYLNADQQNRSNQRTALDRKSMVWCLMEMFWFYFNPQSAWLGNYEKLKQKRLNLA
jgi:hypothetical protein